MMTKVKQENEKLRYELSRWVDFHPLLVKKDSWISEVFTDIAA
jgi:hypothetical protein